MNDKRVNVYKSFEKKFKSVNVSVMVIEKNNINTQKL